MDEDRLLTLFGRVAAPAGRGRTPKGLVRALSIEVLAYGRAFPEADLAALARIPTAAFPAWRTALLDRLARALPGPHVAIPKGQANHATVLEDRRAPIAPDLLAGARTALEAGLARSLSALPPLGRAWLDPALADLVAPFNRRGDSAGLGGMTKGSRLPVGPHPVVRLFVHWTGEVDVDLSALLLDAKMAPMGHVSWTRLAHGRGAGVPMVVHSGDVQNALAGASEFIDVDLAALRRRAWPSSATP